MNKDYKWVFFGTPQISVYFLEELKRLGLQPDLVVTNPDKPVGRKKTITPSPVAVWARENDIDTIKPEKLSPIPTELKREYDFFFVLAYNKILKPEILDIPKFGIINLHPSLLPKYRGPSPIMSAILDDQKETGISLMLLDEEMDHGPILAQEKIQIDEWQKNEILEKQFAELGAQLFFNNHQKIINREITPQEQNHEETTYCGKYKKENMELSLPLDTRQNWLRYCAFPKPFFFDENGRRNVVTEAEWQNDQFIIKKIIPEGKNEREFKQ